METYVTLKRIIDTLPLYARKEMEENGPERTNVSLEEIVKSLSEYEKNTFFKNVEKELPIDIQFSRITLDDFDDDDIIYHLENRGYRVIE
jgi:hypothetical protein